MAKGNKNTTHDEWRKEWEEIKKEGDLVDKLLFYARSEKQVRNEIRKEIPDVSDLKKSVIEIVRLHHSISEEVKKTGSSIYDEYLKEILKKLEELIMKRRDHYIIVDFLYECIDCNPNGDPAMDNQPRLDGNVVTPSKERIKRTSKMGMEWLGCVGDDKERYALWVSGEAIEPSDRLQNLGLQLKEPNLLMWLSQRCVDARLFGATVASKGGGDKGSSQLNWTGPLQVKDGRSVNDVEVIYKMVNAAFASGEEADQRSFGHQYKVPYALIHTTAVYSPVVARWNLKKGVVPPSLEDIDLFVRGLWYGTLNLVSTSKFMHRPVLMVIRMVSEEKFPEELRKSRDMYVTLRRLFEEKEEKEEKEKIRAEHVKIRVEGGIPEGMDGWKEKLERLVIPDNNGKVVVLAAGEDGVSKIEGDSFRFGATEEDKKWEISVEKKQDRQIERSAVAISVDLDR